MIAHQICHHKKEDLTSFFLVRFSRNRLSNVEFCILFIGDFKQVRCNQGQLG